MHSVPDSCGHEGEVPMMQYSTPRKATKARKIFIALCVLAVLAALSMAVPSESALAPSDLAGTWYFYTFTDHPTMHAPGWSRGTLILDAAGIVTGGSRTTDTGLGSTWTGGALAISTEGLISGSVTDSSGVTFTLTEFKLDAEKTAATGVGFDSAGFRFVAGAAKGGGAFVSSDLAGTWYFYTFTDHPTMHAPGWSRGMLILDAAGTVTGGSRTTDTGLGSTWTGGALVISPEGLITGSMTDSSGVTFTLTEFKLDTDKTAATGVGSDSDGFPFVGTLIERGGAFSASDLAGTWYFYTFTDHPTMHAPGWSRGMLILDAAGTVTGGNRTTAAGSTTTFTGGVRHLSLSPEGLITGSVTDSSGVTYTLTEFKLDTDKTAATGVGSDSAGFRFVGTAIKSAPDQTFTLTVGKGGDGDGAVTSSPAGINCGVICSAAFTAGTNVTLSATPASNSGFSGWSGEGCSGTGACSVAMTQPRQVTAAFACVTGARFSFFGFFCPSNSSAGSDGGGGGGGCFIATAAYGSYLDPHVQALRDFRDEYLTTNSAGRAFVALYEAYSPPVAALIARHESLKVATRAVLTPLIYGISYPLAAGMFIFATLVLTGCILRRRRRHV